MKKLTNFLTGFCAGVAIALVAALVIALESIDPVEPTSRCFDTAVPVLDSYCREQRQWS